MKTKPISDTLRIVLEFARVIIWIVIFALTIAIIAMSIAIPFADQFNEMENVSIDFDMDNDWGELLSCVGVFIGFIIALKVVNRLIDITKTISKGAPFEKENGDRLAQIAKYLFIGQCLQIILLAIAGVLSLTFGYAETDFDISFVMLLAAGIAAVLSEVFREGARLREEQELTV